jgi:hypothetical protein
MAAVILSGAQQFIRKPVIGRSANAEKASAINSPLLSLPEWSSWSVQETHTGFPVLIK